MEQLIVPASVTSRLGFVRWVMSNGITDIAEIEEYAKKSGLKVPTKQYISVCKSVVNKENGVPAQKSRTRKKPVAKMIITTDDLDEMEALATKLGMKPYELLKVTEAIVSMNNTDKVMAALKYLSRNE